MVTLVTPLLQIALALPQHDNKFRYAFHHFYIMNISMQQGSMLLALSEWMLEDSW